MLLRTTYLLMAVALLVRTSAVSAETVTLPNGISVKEVDFERHVAPLLGKMGCNAGSCHGSFQGKGGLYLSLFGYSPEKDYQALARDGMGRRVNVARTRSKPDAAKSDGAGFP